MRVRTALQLINRFFAEDDFDHDRQFCLAWFDSQGWAMPTYWPEPRAPEWMAWWSPAWTSIEQASSEAGVLGSQVTLDI